nr:MAG TPA: glutaredoxin-like protein [Caudoviricetes sp.]
MSIVYSKPRCMQCEMTKMWLTQNKIPFEAVDIEANPGALELLRHYGWQTLPVVTLDDELSDKSKAWAGFQIDKLEALL